MVVVGGRARPLLIVALLQAASASSKTTHPDTRLTHGVPDGAFTSTHGLSPGQDLMYIPLCKGGVVVKTA